MLPKPEKLSKKSAKDPEQLDLVKTIDEGNQVESRRRWVIVLLVATIGLSIFFSIYRYTQRLLANPPKLSMPQVSLNTPDIALPDTLDTQINTLIGTSSWSIKLFTTDTDTYRLLWSKNGDNLTLDPISVVKTLSKSTAFPDSVIANILPQGIDYHEKVITTPDFSQHQLFITLPRRQILLISQLNNGDLAQFKSTLPQLVDALYWYAVKN